MVAGSLKKKTDVSFYYPMDLLLFQDLCSFSLRLSFHVLLTFSMAYLLPYHDSLFYQFIRTGESL